MYPRRRPSQNLTSSNLEGLAMPKLDITNANNVVEFHPQKAFFQVKNLGGPKGDKGDRGEPGAGLKIT